jgi:hypothetical protein
MPLLGSTHLFLQYVPGDKTINRPLNFVLSPSCT